MAIYLMLTAEEIDLYGEKLKGLNKYESITRGIFRFEIVKRGDTPYEQLPKEMTRGAAKSCNVLVRLVNSIHSVYCYGLDTVDMTQKADAIRNDLSLIVDDICRKNYKQLEILCERQTETSIKATQEYENANIVKEIFERAQDGDVIAKKDRPTEQLHSVSASTNMAESLGLARDAFADPVADKVERERSEREAPTRKPAITLYLENSVPNGKFYKNGKEKKSFGLKLSIDGNIVNVPITNIDQKMLYVSVLMANLEGRRLRRSDFTFSANDQADTKNFLERVYHSLMFNKDFKDWFMNANVNGPAARINDAKSKLNKDLWNHLAPLYKDAYHYVCLATESARTKDTRYKIRTDKTQIHIDDVIMSRFED